MLQKVLIRDNALLRPSIVGDTIASQDLLSNLTTVGAGTLTASLLLTSIIYRTGPVGAYIDTTDTAANIMNYLSSAASPQTLISASTPQIQVGDSWRVRFVNTVAFACTFTGGTGVTVVNPTINASSVKDYVFQCTAGGVQSIAAVNQTNGSAVLTGMTIAQTSQLMPGQTVTGSGLSGIIISIQSGVGCTLSANATSTLALNAATFNPTFTATGIGQGLL